MTTCLLPLIAPPFPSAPSPLTQWPRPPPRNPSSAACSPPYLCRQYPCSCLNSSSLPFHFPHSQRSPLRPPWRRPPCSRSLAPRVRFCRVCIRASCAAHYHARQCSPFTASADRAAAADAAAAAAAASSEWVSAAIKPPLHAGVGIPEGVAAVLCPECVAR